MSNVNQIVDLMREAAKNLADLMHTAEAESLQVRHFLPDELEGSALMLLEPIDMVLHCPACGLQHIDAPDHIDDRLDCDKANDMVGTRWANPPHRSHLCHGCGHIWRPADVATNGVTEIKTKGKNDTPMPKGNAYPVVTDEMVAAYLKANSDYWKLMDEMPTTISKWRNGTPAEATKVGLLAALSARPRWA